MGLPRRATTSSGPGRFAVVLHLYYVELWPQFEQRLLPERGRFQLFVSLPDPEPAGIRAHILACFPDARIENVPNRGRDVAPFLALLATGDLDGYDAVLKIHGKRTVTRTGGDQWRDELLDDLAPIGGLQAIAEQFRNNPHLGMLAPARNVARLRPYWAKNRANTRALADRLGVTARIRWRWGSFAAGTMFWVRPSAVKCLAVLRASDFEAEEGQADGTTAHAVERLVLELVRATRYHVAGLRHGRRCWLRPRRRLDHATPSPAED